MNNTIIGKWSETVNDEDKRVGMQVIDLCMERDSLNEWVLDEWESLILLRVNMYLCISMH